MFFSGGNQPFAVGEISIWCGESTGGWNEQIFDKLTGTPPFPPVGKTLGTGGRKKLVVIVVTYMEQATKQG